MNRLRQLREWLEYAGGAREELPPGFPRRGLWIVRAVWWVLLAGIIALFCGQTSRFIYIDF